MQNDTEFRKPTVNFFEKDYNPSDRLIVESVYVNQDVPLLDPVLPEDDEPPDPSAARAILEFKLQCRLNSLNNRKQRPLRDPKPDIIFDGQDWTADPVDGKWKIPDAPPQPLPSSHVFSYDDAALLSNLTLRKIVSPSTYTSPTKPVLPTQYQSDTGANASCTNDLSLLHDVQWIEPIACTTANVGTDLHITAIGRMYVTCGNVFLPVIMYYSENAPGTIISPNAICRQFHQTFTGYQKRVNFDHQFGDILFTAREGLEDVILQIKCCNDLWYHSDLRIVEDKDASEPMVSDARQDCRHLILSHALISCLMRQNLNSGTNASVILASQNWN